MTNERIFTKEIPLVGKISGLITLPPDYDETDDRLPVIVFLHGMGERGDGSPAALKKVKRHGVPKLFGLDAGYRGLRVVTVSPQCPEDFTWEQIALPLKDYIDAAVREFRGDKKNVALTGLSMGGFGTWALLELFSEAFVAAAPICGGGRCIWRNPDTMKGKPIRVFHAVDDPVVPIELDVSAAKCAIDVGADVQFTAYCGLGHDCWTKTYEETDLIEWLAGKR